MAPLPTRANDEVALTPQRQCRHISGAFHAPRASLRWECASMIGCASTTPASVPYTAAAWILFVAAWAVISYFSSLFSCHEWIASCGRGVALKRDQWKLVRECRRPDVKWSKGAHLRSPFPAPTSSPFVLLEPLFVGKSFKTRLPARVLGLANHSFSISTYLFTAHRAEHSQHRTTAHTYQHHIFGPRRGSSSIAMALLEYERYMIARGALMVLTAWIPASILFFCSLCLTRRRKDPARTAFTYLKLALLVFAGYANL